MKPLAGRTILVTRAAEDAAAWAVEIERRGGRAVVLPCLATEPERDPALARRLAEALRTADWLALTSRRGVSAVVELLAIAGVAGLPASVKVAAVGPQTGRAAAERVGRADLVASEAHGASLARDLAEALLARPAGAPRPRVVVAAADKAGHQLEDALLPVGVEVVRFTVYRTVAAPERPDKQDLGALGIDTILLASPSAARGLLHQASVPRNATVISIGPSTTKTAQRLGLDVTAEARAPGIDGLLEAIP